MTDITDNALASNTHTGYVGEAVQYRCHYNDERCLANEIINWDFDGPLTDTDTTGLITD